MNDRDRAQCVSSSVFNNKSFGGPVASASKLTSSSAATWSVYVFV